MRKIKLILALLPAILLAGCCYDEKGNLISYEDCPASPAINATFQCNGASCGNSLSAYNGTDSNVWSYKNSGATFSTLSVSITNIPNKEITIVYTNEGTGYIGMPSIPINTALKNEIYPYGDEYDDIFNYPHDVVADEPSELISGPNLSIFDPKVWTEKEGGEYSWKISSCCGDGTRPSTLKKQLTVNGRTINIWVENSEYANGNMNDAKINYVTSYINTIYTNVVKVAGEPWGTHGVSKRIPISQPLHIVFYNTGNSGVGGYFGSYNSYRKRYNSNSNEAITIFLNARMSNEYTLATIAHELTHAVNFYQREIFKSYGEYETFLEEMTAVMMEDVIADKISYHTARYLSWLNVPLYQQNLVEWTVLNPSNYITASSFGAFLLRQYGIDFYKTLLKIDGSSTDALDKAIKVYDSGGLAKALRNWGASIAMFPAATAPKGFGYPARNNDNGFNLWAFDGNSYKSSRTLPISSPKSLAPNAHFPFLRKAVDGKYNESFVVPKGVGVSIVVK